MSVPAIICPCISRFDLFERMLRSIDHPVAQVILIDNSCMDYQPPDLGVRVKVIRPITNIGYGGGINAAIAQTPDIPWWIFMNADVAFKPGALARMDAEMNARAGPRFLFSEAVNPFAFAAISREVVEEVGQFDEWTFFPAYYEDNDYAYRMQLAGLERTPVPVDVIHGLDESREYGSLTIRSDPRYMAANSRTFVENQRRYVEKWGGLPEQETLTTPWGLDVPLSHVRVDLVGRARRAW